MSFHLRRAALFLVSGLTSLAVGQYVPKIPNVDVSIPNRVLKIEAKNACDVDFRNIRMFGENAGWTARLQDGKYEQRVDSAYEAATINQVNCLDGKESGGQHALVTANWLDCGGSCTSIGVAQVFVVREDHPVITQQFVFDSHAKGTGATFDEKSLILTIIGRTDDDSPDCCAKNLDVVRYQWNGSRFTRRSFKRVAAPPADTISDLSTPAQR